MATLWPARVQRKRTRGWKSPESAVYVGRPGRWGNPFIVSKDQTRQQAVDNYRAALLDGRLQNSPARVRRELAGLDLMCWCPLDQPCHADVLLVVANGTAKVGAASTDAMVQTQKRMRL